MPGRVGPTGREQRLVAGISTTLAVVLLAAVGVATLSDPTASTPTVLREGADAQLVLADGTRRPAVVGESVPDGAQVRTGRSAAVLATRDREVHLTPSSEVTVLDGSTQQLDAGSLVVDARGAAGLDVRTAAATIKTRRGVVLRVDDGPLTRITQLAGDGVQVRARDRTTRDGVPRLYQLLVARGSRPSTPSPAMLRGDAIEQRLVGELAAADRMLDVLSAELSEGEGDVTTGAPSGVEVVAAGGPARPAVAVLAALRSDLPSVEPASQVGPAAGERALAYLLATAGEEGDGVEDRFDRVRELRRAGGSWGVVAALLGIDVGDVGARLAALLAPGAPVIAAGSGGDATQALVDVLVGGTSAPGPDSAAPADADPPTGPADSPPAPSSPGPRPSSSPKPPPPSSPPPGLPVPVPVPVPVPPLPAPPVPLPNVPSLPPVPSLLPTSGPLAPVGETVDDVVDAVIDLLSPAPVPRRLPGGLG